MGPCNTGMSCGHLYMLDLWWPLLVSACATLGDQRSCARHATDAAARIGPGLDATASKEPEAREAVQARVARGSDAEPATQRQMPC